MRVRCRWIAALGGLSGCLSPAPALHPSPVSWSCPPEVNCVTSIRVPSADLIDCFGPDAQLWPANASPLAGCAATPASPCLQTTYFESHAYEADHCCLVDDPEDYEDGCCRAPSIGSYAGAEGRLSVVGWLATECPDAAVEVVFDNCIFPGDGPLLAVVAAGECGAGAGDQQTCDEISVDAMGASQWLTVDPAVSFVQINGGTVPLVRSSLSGSGGVGVAPRRFIRAYAKGESSISGVEQIEVLMVNDGLDVRPDGFFVVPSLVVQAVVDGAPESFGVSGVASSATGRLMPGLGAWYLDYRRDGPEGSVVVRLQGALSER